MRLMTLHIKPFFKNCALNISHVAWARIGKKIYLAWLDTISNTPFIFTRLFNDYLNWNHSKRILRTLHNKHLHDMSSKQVQIELTEVLMSCRQQSPPSKWQYTWFKNSSHIPSPIWEISMKGWYNPNNLLVAVQFEMLLLFELLWYYVSQYNVDLLSLMWGF